MGLENWMGILITGPEEIFTEQYANIFHKLGISDIREIYGNTEIPKVINI